jgi:hypothetical protein
VRFFVILLCVTPEDYFASREVLGIPEAFDEHTKMKEKKKLTLPVF